MVKIQVFKKGFHTHIYLDYARVEFLSNKKKRQLTVEIKETLRRIYYITIKCISITIQSKMKLKKKKKNE